MALEILTKEENLLKNLAVFKSKTVDGEVLAVLNANAYGHGMVRVARILEGKVDGFSVVDEHDSEVLIRCGIKKPIIVKAPTTFNKNAPFDRSKTDKDIATIIKSDFLNDNLSLYGYPRGEFLPVMEVYSDVLDVFKLPPHTNLGRCKVGRFGTTVATVRGGFADGIGCDFVGSHLLINEKLYPIVAVFTNTTFLKVDGEVNIGDKVCICGSSGRRCRYFDEVSREVGTDIRELMIRFGNLEKNEKD